MLMLMLMIRGSVKQMRLKIGFIQSNLLPIFSFFIFREEICYQLVTEKYVIIFLQYECINVFTRKIRSKYPKSEK